MQRPKSKALKKYYQKRRRKRQIRGLFLGMFFLAGLVATAYFLSNGKSAPSKNTAPETVLAGAQVDSNKVEHKSSVLEAEIENTLLAMAGQNPKVQKIMNNRDAYPTELLNMLARNEETLDFVANYPEKKNSGCAKTVGNVQKGTIPLLLQWDERWGYGSYGDSIIAVSGCGPTALSMVVAGLTGKNDITPYTIASYAMKNGFYVKGTGTSWDLMTIGCQQFGVKGSELPLNENAVLRELKNGNPIICSMRPGDFTTTGHFIVLTGYKDGKIQVNDPNSKKRSGQLWDYERLASQINNLWVYKKK